MSEPDPLLRFGRDDVDDYVSFHEVGPGLEVRVFEEGREYQSFILESWDEDHLFKLLQARHDARHSEALWRALQEVVQTFCAASRVSPEQAQLVAKKFALDPFAPEPSNIL